MLNKLREGLNFYLAHFGWIDFAAYIWLIFMFLALLAFCIYLTMKFRVVGFLLLMLNIAAFVFGLFYVGYFLDQNLRARSLELVSQKKLTYSDTLLIDLKLTNLSKKPFKYCRIDLKFYRSSGSFLKNQINMLKPILREKTILKDTVDINETRRIQSVINNFKFTDYNITASSECF